MGAAEFSKGEIGTGPSIFGRFSSTLAGVDAYTILGLKRPLTREDNRRPVFSESPEAAAPLVGGAGSVAPSARVSLVAGGSVSVAFAGSSWTVNSGSFLSFSALFGVYRFGSLDFPSRMDSGELQQLPEQRVGGRSGLPEHFRRQAERLEWTWKIPGD